MKMKKLCVIGSINIDLVAEVSKFPKPGETLIGTGFNTYTGGKGANQAVALGKLGADVAMVGKLGDDLYGKQYIDAFKQVGVDVSCIDIEEGISSGIAVIEVDKNGENNIVVVPGANGRVDRAFIHKKLDQILSYDIFLLQLEIPIDTVEYLCKELKKNGKTVILDPAPAMAIPEEVYKNIDYITPNETELQILSGEKCSSEEELICGARKLQSKGVANVIIKAGKNGAYIITEQNVQHIKGFKVEAIDTTAAGDSFNAGFAYALSCESKIEDCVRFGNAVGALSTTAKGAQGAMPTLEAVNELLKDNK